MTERIPNPTNQKVANPIGKNEAVQRVAEGVDEEARVREDVMTVAMTVAMTVVAIVVMTLVTTAVTIRKAVKRVAEVVVALTNDPVKDRMAAGDADVEMTIGMMCMSKKNVQPVTVRTMRMTARRIVEGAAAAGVVGAVDEDAALKPVDERDDRDEPVDELFEDEDDFEDRPARSSRSSTNSRSRRSSDDDGDDAQGGRRRRRPRRRDEATDEDEGRSSRSGKRVVVPTWPVSYTHLRAHETS